MKTKKEQHMIDTIAVNLMGWEKCVSNYGRRLKGKITAWCDPSLEYSDKTIGQSRNYKHPKVAEYDSWNPFVDWNATHEVLERLMQEEKLLVKLYCIMMDEYGLKENVSDNSYMLLIYYMKAGKRDLMTIVYNIVNGN